MKLLEKYHNGVLGPVSDLYEARYSEYAMYTQFKDRFWFDRELQYHRELQHKNYCYEMIDVDVSSMLIVYKYESNNLNHLLYENKNIDIDYKKQVRDILADLQSEGIYKINIYPHTFFIQDGKIKISDLYGCTTKFTIVPQEMIGDIINDKERFKFVDGHLDCVATYNYTIENSTNYWPEDFLNG